MQYSMHGVPYGPQIRSALTDSPEEHKRQYEKAWRDGGLFSILYSYNDLYSYQKQMKLQHHLFAPR